MHGRSLQPVSGGRMGGKAVAMASIGVLGHEPACSDLSCCMVGWSISVTDACSPRTSMGGIALRAAQGYARHQACKRWLSLDERLRVGVRMSGRELNRRSLLAGGVAASASASFPAWAHEQAPFVMPADYLPTIVAIDAMLPPGELHVVPDLFRLYWILPEGEAIRFTVGIGQPGLYHPGRFTVGDKREWPSWRPTPEMIERNPEAYARWADGMPGGIDNPLGARALYLYDDAGRDTYLRIHGTNDPRTIGTAVSNGCARLTNDDITLLYGGVPVGTLVFLHQQDAMGAGSRSDLVLPAPPVERQVEVELPQQAITPRAQPSAVPSRPLFHTSGR